MYEVLVGNVGSVYLGSSERLAWDHYHHYVKQSQAHMGGRACGESVTLMERVGQNWEIKKEFVGGLDKTNQKEEEVSLKDWEDNEKDKRD
jgi:hypothetical protein